MDWLKLDYLLPDKREVVAIAARLGLDQDAAAMKCVRVWIWFEQNTDDGSAKSVTKEFVDRLVHATGFADAMVDVGWLIYSGGALRVPKFDRHLGPFAKRRAQSDARVKGHRDKKCNARSVTEKCNAPSVTQSATSLFDKDLEQQEVHGGG